MLSSSAPSDVCGVDSVTSITQSSEPDDLLTGLFTWEVPARPVVHYSGGHTYSTHLISFLLLFCYFFLIIWQMFSLKFTLPIQIYNTLEGVSMALAHIHSLISC